MLSSSPHKGTATPRSRASHNTPTGSTVAPSISTSPLGLQSPRSAAGSPYSFGLSSPRGTTGRTKQKSITAHLFWISIILLLGTLTLSVGYQWGKSAEGVQPFLLHESSIATIQEPVEFPFPQPIPQSAAVFYHIYLPPTPEGRDNSARIIQEQLQQLQQSKHLLTIYYNTIGEETPQLNTAKIQQFCQQHGQTCHPMHHYDEGMEDKTLQRLHDFCTVSDSDSSIVYLHNKGSFSTKPLNEAWRYQMTQSVVSDQCQTSVSSSNNNGSCNLCGLWFSAERGMFMAGNMWRTQCSYVKQLIAPQNFQSTMYKVTSEAMMERLRYKLLMTMQELRAGVFGIDRYATEFWIASHPTVRPCDFSKAIAPLPPAKTDITDHFLNWLRKMGDQYQGKLQPEWFSPQAPHHPLPLPPAWQVSKFPDVRLREYFLLAGSLFRWFVLYQQAPPADSWVYQWFPDGETWRKAVEQHGLQAVDVITTQALKTEVQSGRNRYTADHSKKLTTAAKGAGATAKTTTAAAGKQIRKKTAPKGTAKKRFPS